MKRNLYYFARINALLVFVVGLFIAIYESSTVDSTFTIFTTSGVDSPFSWAIFVKWMFVTYCTSTIFYILSEMIKASTNQIE